MSTPPLLPPRPDWDVSSIRGYGLALGLMLGATVLNAIILLAAHVVLRCDYAERIVARTSAATSGALLEGSRISLALIRATLRKANSQQKSGREAALMR